MTTVSNGLAAHGSSLQEPVYNSIPTKVLSPPSSTADSTEHRMISLLGKKKNIKELKNTKLVIRRLPQNITMTELTKFLTPIPDHNYLYLARGDTEFSREDMLFSRAYINLSSQEDAVGFCKRLDGFPFKSAGRIYRPVFEFAPFHRVPKRTSVKTDNKEGTIVADPDYIAYIQSLQENNKPPVEEKTEHEKKTDVPQTTPLIQHLIQKHKYTNRSGVGARSNSTSYSEPKVIKKRISGGVKETDYAPTKERKTFRGPPAQTKSKVTVDTPPKPNPKAGSVIIVTDKSSSVKKGSGLLSEDRTAIVHDNYSKHGGVASEYSSRSNKSSPAYYQSERGDYPSKRGSGSGSKKRGRGAPKYPSDYNGHGYQQYKDWEYEDKGGYDRKGRYENWYGSGGDGGGSRGRSDRGRSFDYDNQHYYSSRGGRQY